MSEINNELLKYREMMYRLLSSIYINEVDRRMLDVLKKMEFPVSEETSGWQQNLNAGYILVTDYLAGFDGKSEAEADEMLEDLAADYAKTFLAAGDATGKAAIPYESVYTGTDSRFGGSLQMRLSAVYAARGLEIKRTGFKIMEDHIGLELGYMAEMLRKTAEAADDAQKCELQKEAAEFFAEHLSKWVNRFAGDVYKYSERDFYRGFARITLGFIEGERDYLAG